MQDRSTLYLYKGNCCGHCGKTVEEVIERWGTINRMFEFNHIDPATKSDDYDNLIRRTLSREQLDEVDKCVLLCVECHKALHAQNITGQAHLVLNLPGNRNVEQTFKGQFLFDLQANTQSFFTDEQPLIFPFYAFRGRAEPELLTGLDLGNGRFIQLVSETRETERLAFKGMDNQYLMIVRKLDNESFRLQYNVRFTYVKFEFRDSEGTPLAWVRNGTAIQREGMVMKEGWLNSVVEYRTPEQIAMFG
jgi:hypothetical protein